MEQSNSYPGEQWKPIFDYMVDTFDVSLTLSQMEALVNGVSKVIGYDALQAKCDKYERALRHITELNRPLNDDTAILIAGQALCNEALSGEKEVKPSNDMALYETRLAMRMLLKVFKSVEKSPEQEKYYSQADYIFKKHHNVTDVLRGDQKEDKQ